MKIAIVGSGLAGLTAAYCLGDDHEVHLYERHGEVGMDAFGCNIDLGQGDSTRVDVPLRVISPSYYANLTRFFEEIGVHLTQEHYSFSFSDICEPTVVSNTFWTNTNWFLFGKVIPTPSLASLFSKRAWSISWHFLKLLVYARWDWKALTNEKTTFYEWLKSRNFSDEAIHDFVYPLMSGILTCDFQDVANYPAGILLEYIARGQGEGVYRASGGSKEVCQHLTKKCKGVHLNARVQSIHSIYNHRTQQLDFVQLVHEGGTMELYDRVIIGTQAHQAKHLLHHRPSELTAALETFKCASTHIVCHTDSSVMPGRRKDWKVINFGVDEDSHSQRSMTTIYMNALLPKLKGGKDVFQTLNPTIQPAEENILAQCWPDRPVFTSSCLDSVDTIWKHQGSGGIYICGSYCVHGIPLLEAAVTSAAEVAKRIGIMPSFFADSPSNLPGSNKSSQSKVESNRNQSRSWPLRCVIMTGLLACSYGGYLYVSKRRVPLV